MPPNSNGFAGRVALVTGSAAGIGLASARSLAEAGASVFLTGLDGDQLRDVLSEFTLAGLIAAGSPADLRDSRAGRDLVTAALDRFGRLDIVVNSAGVQRYGTVLNTSEETWDEVFEINVKSIFRVCGAAVPAFRRQDGGSIVNISSVQAFTTQTDVAAYTASKAAILGLTRAMAVDHAGEGIRVNAVCPGSVDTPMLRWAAERLAAAGQRPDELISQWGAAHPIGRVAAASEVAAAVLFLAGPDASFITGAELCVDGGLSVSCGATLPPGGDS